jgi:hypothetical protein
MVEVSTILLISIPNWQIKKFNQQANKVSNFSWLEPYENTEIKPNYKILILTSHGIGESTLGFNLGQAAKNLGWSVLTLDYTKGHEIEIEEFKPDFAIVLGIHLQWSKIEPTAYKKYMLLDTFTNIINYIKYEYFSSSFKIQPKYKKLFLNSDGFLCTTKEIELFKNAAKHNNKAFHAIPFFTYAPKTSYKYNEPNKIITIGNNWDPLRNGKRYRQLFQMLSKDNMIAVYGPERAWDYIKESWGGFIPHEDIIKSIQKNGIALVLHSEHHFNNNLLTNRIMEAISASAIVISDRNPAVIENFGDNILYIDHTASAEEIYSQIKKHYEWIKSHPKEVSAMTKRNHEIFLEKFTAENGLINVAKMHEYILQKEKSTK